MPKEIDLPDGVTRRKVTHYPENKLGRVTYEYSFDTGEIRKARNFEASWTDGPVRFRIVRSDKRNRWKFHAEPAGNVSSMHTGRKEDHYTGSSRGGGQHRSTSILSTEDKPWDGQTTFVKVAVDHWYNPLTADVLSADALDRPASVFTQFGGALRISTDDEYPLTTAMLRAQVGLCTRHVVGKVRHEITRSPGGAVTKLGSWLKGKAKSASPVTKEHVTEAKWKAGVGEKPMHVIMRKRQKERSRQQPPQQRRGAPPGQSQVKDENNKCSGCGGFYLKDDLQTASVEKQGGQLSGTEYNCPDCGTTVAADVNYNGPVPVQVGPNTTELH